MYRAVQPRFFRYIDEQIADCFRADYGEHRLAIWLGQG
jgi:hypothetical protein